MSDATNPVEQLTAGDARYLRPAGGPDLERPMRGIAHLQDPAWSFQSEPHTGLRQDPETGEVFWRRKGVDLYSMDDGGGGGLSATAPLDLTGGVLTLAGLSTLGTALYMPRTNAAGTAWEYRSPAQVLSDIGAAAAAHTHLLAAGATDVTATAAELNILDGATLTVTELNYVDGVTSAIQAQIDAKQPLDATLTALAGLATGADKLAYSTGTDTFAQTDLSSFARSLLDDANAAAGRDTLGASSGVWGLAVGGTGADLSGTGPGALVQAATGATITVSTLPATLGGTGQTTTTTGDLLVGGAANTWSKLGAGATSGHVLTSNGAGVAPSWQAAAGGVTDHGALTGLGDDDHSIYALLAGRSGGQTITGGTGSGDDLTLLTTSHGTKGNIFFGASGLHTYDAVNARWGMGVAAPARTLEVRGGSGNTTMARFSYDGTHNSEVDVTAAGNLTVSLTGTCIAIGAALPANVATPSITIGKSAVGTRDCVVIGNSATLGSITARFGVAIGNNITGGGGSTNVLIGYGVTNVATGSNFVVIGANASVTGGTNTGTVVGGSATIGGGGAVAIGNSASAATTGCIAIGDTAVSSANTCIAIGRDVVGDETNSFIMGSTNNRIDNLYGGRGRTAVAPSSFGLNGTGGSGTDIAGGDLVIAPGRGSGSALPGNLFFAQNAGGAASGTTVRALANYAVLDTAHRFGIGIVSGLTARLQVEEATLGNEVFRFETTATNDDPSLFAVQARAATTNATVTTLLSYTVAASKTYAVEARVVARRTGGTAGTAEDGAAYVIRACVKNVAGTATLVGAVSAAFTVEDQAGWDATIDVTGATFRVRVTGAVDNNITWHATLILQDVGS